MEDYKECTDCVHYEFCLSQEKYLIEHNRKDLIRRYGFGLHEVENCKFFKDRSRFVELPCHVGDTVYMLTEQTQKLGRRKVTNKVIVKCCVDNFRIGDAGYPSAALCDNENVWCYGVEPKMFGDVIFFTREEAEQALKEREKNDH